MNPSAAGWIKKLLKLVTHQESFIHLSKNDFYEALKSCGFIYGNNVDVVHQVIEKNDLTSEELSKVNLLIAFYYCFKTNPSDSGFINSIIEFYAAIIQPKTSFLDGFLGEKKSATSLEGIIDKRVYINDNLFTKNFNYFITNALLFVDVLAYQKFLDTREVSNEDIQFMEAALETIVINVLDSKQVKSNYDESLIKLFEASRRYQGKEHHLEYKEALEVLQNSLEKHYAFDLGCMASWTDQMIDPEEYLFLNQLGDDLQLTQSVINQSIKDINTFYITNQDQIALLGSKNLVQNFYDNSSKMVSKLIKRNSKRLLKELSESKELLVLLTKSTTRDLTEEEQKKMQTQLLDIIKSIPSLAIFMLPGGAILLPLFVKFIPKLLPTAFDDNRIEE
ncbi:LETM1-related biofilm-associated protein [Geojedonia litorea]|uniref:LETM1-related biofilm-associated protein n=1 Tax=Geojedonia litorea TaxID=1268269 RepID=A0ABV9MYY7_9FLAO